MGGEWRGRVEEYLRKQASEGPLHFSLIDPDELDDPRRAGKLVKPLVEAGTDAILIGGSLGVTESLIDEVVEAVRPYGLPVILFPGNVNGISGKADAILFMSLLNSEDPYYIIGAQVQGAIIVRRLGLEPLPTAYIVAGYGGAAGYVGRARPIPIEKPEIAVAYALAAEMMGMKYIYLEAGSGSPSPLPPSFVGAVKKALRSSLLIVGGGIRRPEQAVELVKAGADIIVTGTIVEHDPDAAARIVRAIKGFRHTFS